MPSALTGSGWPAGGQAAPAIAIVMGAPARRTVGRRARVAKTDPIDARRLMRHRERLVRTRVRLPNTSRARHRLYGLADLAPGAVDFDDRRPPLRTPHGTPLPAGRRGALACRRDQRAVIVKQLAAIAAARAERVAPPTRPDGAPSMAATLGPRVGSGANEATRWSARQPAPPRVPY